MKPNYLFFLLIGLSLSLCFYAQKRNYWLSSKDLPALVRSIKYDKIIAYDVKPNQKHKNLVYKQVRIDTSVIVSKKELTKNQIDSLEKFVFSSKNTQNVFPKGCVCPHIAFVYYLDGKMVGYFTSFFENDNYKLTVTSITKSETSENYFYMVFDEVNRKRLNNLCSMLNFSYCKRK